MAYALGASADEHCEIIMNDLIIMLRWCQCVGVCMPVSEYLCGIFNDANNLLMLPTDDEGKSISNCDRCIARDATQKKYLSEADDL